jgi:hypothetical protein
MSKQGPRSPSVNRWFIAIVIGFVVYGLAQPYLSVRLGIQLPSLGQLINDTGSTSGGEAGGSGTDEIGEEVQPSRPKPPPPPESGSEWFEADTPASKEPLADPTSVTDPLTEYLRETPPGSENFVSPQGLRYTRGSQEGHRLKHLERHLTDQPSRPGKHGVFTADLLQVLQWLDDAYERGKRKARGTRQRTEEGRTVYEVPFDFEVGYVGGQVGGRAGKPKCKQIRLVVEDDRLITAFPF